MLGSQRSSAHVHTAEAILDRAEKKAKSLRVLQLSSLRIYHQNKIDELDRELKELLRDEVGDIDY